jgi:hypothetical protein
MMMGVFLLPAILKYREIIRGYPLFIKIHNRLSTFMFIAGIGSIEPKMGGVPGGWGRRGQNFLIGALN